MGETIPKADFEVVYEDNFKYVYNFIYMKVLHRETAEDLTSETFTNAFKSYDRYDPQIASVRTWLCSIALHAIGMQIRKASTQREILADTLPETPTESEDTVSVFAINREAERILSLLDENERHILALRLSAELSYKEIADLMNISEKAASERYRRVIIKCRKFTQGKSMEDFI